MREGRWTTVTPSQFQHEREALRHVQDLLPDAEPYRAWSNFTFTAGTGHVREVDLFVVGRGGLFLVEIKSLNGRLTASGSNWILTGQRGQRVFDNPLHLANAKAKELRSLLTTQAHQRRLGAKIPFIQAAVFLSVPSLQVVLPEHHLHNVFGPQTAEGHAAGSLPPIGEDLVTAPPRDERDRIRPDLSRSLPGLLKAVGIARSRRRFQIGAWELEDPPFDTGPTWQDHHARHGQLEAEQRRIRIYLVERHADKGARASIERAARREMLALHGISHPGIVQVDAMEQHEAGPALIFRHRPDAMRLDHYMAQHGSRLDAGTRLDLIRQLAEAVGYAHGRQLRHRALSARSVFVTPASRRRVGEQDEAWLSPRLTISDWQAATRGPGTDGTATASVLAGETRASQIAPHLEASAQGYLAPEFTAQEPDPVAMDVFGLGALSYLVLAGDPPAATRPELLARLEREQGLRPSAVADSVSESADSVVQEATQPVPGDRPASVSEFLELLTLVEDEMTAPATRSRPPVGGDPEAMGPDPLEARPGDLVGGEWRITKRLGTGSTSRAFLARNERTGADEVLKVALSDAKAPRLEHEARVLRGLTDSRIIRLARQEPITVGHRTVLVLEHAGDRTVARKLRDEGRLTVDDLEIFSDYLFGAVDFLEGEGITHRDLKPDNIAIRIRKNRSRQLVLFDFSLAGISVNEIEAGTPRYLDPFLGTPGRPVYDDAAERYALAVTLHEMASGELPKWGDGAVEVRFTEGPSVLATEAFDPAVRDELVGFFTNALDRDASRRFASLKDMRDAWLAVFRRVDATVPPGSVHPEAGTEPSDDVATRALRDVVAAKVVRETVLESAGLSLRAVSAARELGAGTVGDLLSLGSKQVISLPGIGVKTRRELQRRVRQWRSALGEPRGGSAGAHTRRKTKPAAGKPSTGADAGSHPIGDAQPVDDVKPGARADPDQLARTGLDEIVARLVPVLATNRRNATEVNAIRLLLGLSDPDSRAGDALPTLAPWARQPLVADVVGVTPGRIAQILSKQRGRWRSEPLVGSVRDELIALLDGGGRVMGVAELAAALLARRGSLVGGVEERRALSLAAVRAAAEIDALEPEPRLLTRRHGDRLLVALEADPDRPGAPSAPSLLDYADALGRAADRLADLDVLPAPATVLRELATVRVASMPGAAAGGAPFDDRRLVQVAAVASQRAAASPRLEIYPRDLDPVRALRLAQAGLVPRHPEPDLAKLTVKQIRERVQGRFPEMDAPLPEHPELDQLLRDAGFEVVWRGDAYAPVRGAFSSTGVSTGGTATARRPTARGVTQYTASSPDIAAAVVAEQRLEGSAAGDGFRALTVRRNRYPAARLELARRFGAQGVDVAELFLAALHAQVDSKPLPTWQTILAADAAEPGSRPARKLGEYVEGAWEKVQPQLREIVGDSGSGGGPVLVHDAAPLARYRAMDVLYAVADRARAGGRPTWLLCPVDDPSLPPRLDGEIVQVVTENEWIMLPDAWVANEHRGGEKAS